MELQNESQKKLEHQQNSPGSRKNTVNLRALTTSLTTTNVISTGASVSKNSPKTALLRSKTIAHLTPQCGPQVEATPQVHPFANTTSKLELIPPSSSTTVDGINVEEEARLYDELCRNYEDETDAFSQSDVPVRHTSSSSRLVKPKAMFKPPRPHSIAPESIFSADIFLADNTSPSSSPLFSQNVRISGWSTVGDPATGKALISSITVGKGAGAYVVYDIVITTREGTTMHVLKRYTAFEQLWGALKRTLPSHLLPALPTLPPKAPLARFRPAFLDSRRKLLQFWLARVLLHPEIGWRAVVREWVLS